MYIKNLVFLIMDVMKIFDGTKLQKLLIVIVSLEETKSRHKIIGT